MSNDTPVPEPPPPSGELDARLYAELRALAASFLGRERAGHTLQPTALVHEAWIRLSSEDDERWSDRAHVFAVSARVMRRVLVDHARGKQAAKRGGDRERITLSPDITPMLETDADEVDLLALDEALDRLAQLNERQARVVELRFFAGLTVEESAEALGVSVRTVAGDWRLARAWLARDLDAGRKD
jgi:RNA polymerase sigma factor (TIGR02999 family)